MERRGSAESWRRLRQYRSAFLDVTEDEDLQTLFSSALHQAEQQFRAAITVGPESRPLNLFYGLSQAGRAVAAAASLRGSIPAQLNGHGIKCIDLQNFRQMNIPDLSTLKVRSDAGSPQASFPVLSDLLKSPDLSSAINFVELCEMLVEPQFHAPLRPPQHPVLLARGDALLGPEGSGTRYLHLEGVPASVDVGNKHVYAKFSAAYPSLAGSTFDKVEGLSKGRDGRSDTQSIQVSWVDSCGPFTSTYRQSPVVLPAPPGGNHPMDPLMIWWAVLYGLSMLARYEPASWTKLIDVNASSSAVPIEFLLNTALEAVPDLLADTIGQVLSRETDQGPNQTV